MTGLLQNVFELAKNIVGCAGLFYFFLILVGKVLDAADNIKQKLRSLRKRGRAYREYKRLYNDFCTYRTDLEHWREMHERWAKVDE